MPQSTSKKAPWDLTQFSLSPSYFPEFHQWSEIFSLSKVILVLGNTRSHREPNLCCMWAESTGWFDVFPKKLCMRHDAWVGTLSWQICQSPVACSCGLLNDPSSFCGGMFKLNAKFDADSLLYSLSHFECDSHTVHMLTQGHLLHPWLVQWSCHCSLIHSPWLPGFKTLILEPFELWMIWLF